MLGENGDDRMRRALDSRGSVSASNSPTKRGSTAARTSSRRMLREVIRAQLSRHRSKSRSSTPKRRADDYPNIDPDSAERRQADRHPLVWNGVIYYATTTITRQHPVRLRNISVTGAMIESATPVPSRAEPLLELQRGACRFPQPSTGPSATRSGLGFHAPFDMHLPVGDAGPTIAAAAGAADLSQPAPEASDHWSRSTVEQLRAGARRLPQALARPDVDHADLVARDPPPAGERSKQRDQLAVVAAGSPSGCSSAAPRRRTPAASPWAMRE